MSIWGTRICPLVSQSGEDDVAEREHVCLASHFMGQCQGVMYQDFGPMADGLKACFMAEVTDLGHERDCVQQHVMI